MTGGRGVANRNLNVPTQLGPEVLVELGQVGQQGQVTGFPGVDGEGDLLAVGVSAIVAIGSAVADGFEEFLGFVDVVGARPQVFAPTQGVGGHVGPAVGVHGFRRVQAVDDGVLVDGVLGGLPRLNGEAPQFFDPTVYVHHPVVRRLLLPGDGRAVDALEVRDHVDVGLDELGLPVAQRRQPPGRLGHHLYGQRIESDAAVLVVSVLWGPEEVVKLLEGILLLQHEVSHLHGTDADGIGFITLEPGRPGAVTHCGFRHDHGAGPLGILRPVEGEVQAHGLEGDLHLVVGRSLADALNQVGQRHVAGLVVPGIQQLESFRAHPAVQVEVHVIASDHVAVVGLDEPVVDAEGPDLAVLADRPVLGDGRGQLAAALAAHQSDLEYPLELEVLTLGQQRIEFAVADVGDQQGDVAAGFLGHGSRIGGFGHGGRSRRSRTGGSRRGRGRRGGGRFGSAAAGYRGDQARSQAQRSQQPQVNVSFQSHCLMSPPLKRAGSACCCHAAALRMPND